MNRMLWLTMVVVLSGCATDRATSKGRLKDYWGQVSTTDSIRTRGIGSPSEKSIGQTQRRGTARNAALVAARYEMLQVIKGIKVTGGLSIGQLMQTNGEIREVADRIIHGAEELQTEWMADDGCVVTLELKRAKVDEIVRQDKPYEPPPPTTTFKPMVGERVQAIPRATDKSRWVSPDHSPNKALALGLLIPGWGYFYSCGGLDQEASNKAMLKGIVAMGGTLGLVGVGVDQMGNKVGDGSSKKNQTTGLILTGIGAALHVYAAFDAKSSLERPEVEPYMAEGAFGARYTWKF